MIMDSDQWQFNMVKLKTCWDSASDHVKPLGVALAVYWGLPALSELHKYFYFEVLNLVKSLNFCFWAWNLIYSVLQISPLLDDSRCCTVVDKARDFLISAGRILDKKNEDYMKFLIKTNKQTTGYWSLLLRVYRAEMLWFPAWSLSTYLYQTFSESLNTSWSFLGTKLMFLNKTDKFVYRDFGFSLKSRCIKYIKKKHFRSVI